MKLNEMREHVMKLSRDMKVTVKFGREFKSSVRHSLIEIQGLDNERDYASTLHELGHQYQRMNSIGGINRKSTQELCCPSHTSKDDIVAVLMNEWNAWEFARKNSIIGWTEEMEDELIRGFGSYVSMALNVFSGDINELFDLMVSFSKDRMGDRKNLSEDEVK